ncbi:Rap guanine nucleotide exchange factor 1 [Aphelenchoides bicaudatus]|nr:Rap guanine nucleotide exchange factor 1 [Aphelenchoides bicaudatus]
MEQLIARIRRLRRVADFPDPLLTHLLSNSDFTPDRVSSGIILFKQGEYISGWYLLLVGEVELYLRANNQDEDYCNEHVKTLREGSLFGELNLYHHSCSCLVKKSSEFIRITQHHFLSLYNKYADLLQPFIIVMGDLVNDKPPPTTTTSAFTPVLNKKSLSTIEEEQNNHHNSKHHYPSMSASSSRKASKNDFDTFAPPQMNGTLPSSNYKHSFDFSRMKRELPSVAQAQYTNNVPNNYIPATDNNHYVLANGQMNGPSTSTYHSANLHQTIDNHEAEEWTPPVNLFELSNSISQESRVYEAGLILKRTMQLRSSGLIKERHVQRSNKIEVFPNVMSGSDMTAWLNELAIDCLVNTTKPLTKLQLTGMWQALLDNHLISHVTNEHQFKDKFMFYKWTIDDPFEDYFDYRAHHSNLQIMTESGLINPVEAPPLGAEPPSIADLHNAIFFLSTVAPDALFRIILGKSPCERTPEELELVYEELLHVKALTNMSSIVKRELASVIRFEEHQNAGTVLFHQGEKGKNWYIILRGSVDVSVAGKGIVCNLQEGDDFGKLALVNESPRAATISVSKENSQFLKVDKFDFNRIIRDVEQNTVRLKEHGQDVLVLERIDVRFQDGQTTPRNQCCYSVMAGLAEKMIEYVLETRIDAQTDENSLDTFLEDLILTHIIYMPTNILCNYLKNYYATRGDVKLPSAEMVQFAENDFNFHERLTAKRRVISFLGLWQYILGIHFFFDPVANSFVEEIFCCVLEDCKIIPNMTKVLDQITRIQQTRENAMRFLSRHPATVLDNGFYSLDAPASNPILPIDTCQQCIYLSDGTYSTIPIRLDKTAREIARMACVQLRGVEPVEECFLIEVKSNGERVVFSPTEVSVPTMLSLNGRLFTVYKDEIDTLTPLPDQHGPTEPIYNSVLDLMSSSQISEQLFMHHTNLFEATDELELVFQVVGRDKFNGKSLERTPSNLDILLRRFNEIQFWTTTEILLAPNPSKRVNVLKKFIKIALYSKEHRDLMSLFAITLGLSNVSVSRLTNLWDKLPSKLRRQFSEFESLLDPSRNHRAYRMLVSKMHPPIIPFVPLLLKDLTFIHEGNKTYFANMVNFEKMHMIANVLRSFRNCKAKYPTVGTARRGARPLHQPSKSTASLPGSIQSETHPLIKNFAVIDNQAQLMQISYKIEPSNKQRHY